MQRHGLTLVELLIAIAVIGLLLAMLLPAVQSARESSRRAQCKSQLRQIGVGLLLFHDAHQAFPQGGWGRAWVPIPERGIGKRQPGGWIYQTLAYYEEHAAQSATLAGQAGTDPAEVVAAVGTSISIFNCPSRRPSYALPAGTSYPYQRSPRPGGTLTVVARGDYAINAGSSHAFRLTGPPTLELGDRELFWRNVTDNRGFTGISHLRRSASLPEVTDGTSKTYLAGEKFLAPQHYLSGGSIGDDDSLYSGFANDNHRFAASRLAGPGGASVSSILHYPPLQDTDKQGVQPATHTRFGSAHPGGCNMLNCDGSVSVLTYEVDPQTHYLAGHRSDNGDLDH